MIHVSAAAYLDTNADISKALFNATSTIDPAKLRGNEILIAALGLPINPSDCKQIEGSYKTPINFQRLGQDAAEREVAVGGNEGAFRVVAVGSDVVQYKVGDWVILKLTSFGTWRTHAIVRETADNRDPLIVVLHDGSHVLSVDEASTISTNPSTAYQLLHHYVHDWAPGDWLVTNAGTSFVSKYLYQLARHYGIRTLAVVRSRPDLAAVEAELTGLGATKVITEDTFTAADFATAVLPTLVGDGARVRLALDSLGGPTTPNLVASLSAEGTFVNYGGLAGGLVLYSAGVQLAKNITLKSYWLTRNTRTNPQSKVDTVKALLELYKEKVFQPVHFTDVPFTQGDNLRDLFVHAITKGRGKQVVVFPEHRADCSRSQA